MSKKRIKYIVFIIIIFIISIIISAMYYDNKYIVSFDTGTEEEVLSQYLEKDKKVKMPKNPTKEGYIFVEWQLNGKKYDFDSKVTSDINLTAKWVKEEYITIKYVTDSNYEIEDTKILKGESLSHLPVAYKDNYEFIGWYINDKEYLNTKLYDDTTLKAKYKLIKEDIKVGDKVLIVGNYSKTSFESNSINKRAIGWERYVLNIIDSEYPYVVGDSTGVTGFFKEDSLKIVK